MKKIIKFWDILLVALLGILGTGCKIDEPPPAEYGPEPEYGPPYYSVDITNHISTETNKDEN